MATMLMLGGTGFVGRAIVEEAVARRWEVTLFNRGKRAVPEGVARVVTGEREGDLAALGDGEWDAVVDTWSGPPAVVGRSAAALKGRAGRYAYVSSRSVYAYPPPLGGTEDAPLVDAGDGDYAQVKRGAEVALEETFGDAALLLRAGLILGPYEDIGRLPWWLNRIARGGRVLAPGPRDLPLQYVDVRDLAAWTLDAVLAGLGGPYDIVSEPGHATMGSFLDACAAATGSAAEFVWADPDTITDAGVQPWTDLPLWLPPGPEHDGMHGANPTKALRAGLRCRDVTATVADTWSWLQSIGGRPPHRPDRPPVGLAPETEAQLLAALR
ncbi:NAD-dependent epimerase/dehydratase family protein [Streptomyces sp. NPDC021020]|uniref:NAD-dependent epimerase/dehydratase family protein n=1 Tax=Streptomyces sp. NPDC021020 TaxID=3365109 RepID=UPI0037A4F02D